MSLLTTSDVEFERDVRRTLILGGYIRAWGMPDSRVVSRQGSDAIEVYSFPSPGSPVHRFATVGVSALRRENGDRSDRELFMALPPTLGGAEFEEVTNFILDVCIYSLREDVDFARGQTIPPTDRAPSAWAARAALLDEPRGEPEELAQLRVGSQQVELVWIVPIHQHELELIHSKGLDAFDQLQELSDWSLADPNRPPVTAVC